MVGPKARMGPKTFQRHPGSKDAPVKLLMPTPVAPSATRPGPDTPRAALGSSFRKLTGRHKDALAYLHPEDVHQIVNSLGPAQNMDPRTLNWRITLQLAGTRG